MRRIPFPQLYTLRDLAQRSHLPRDVIQRWGNVGILIAEGDSAHGGRGVHRRFQASEMMIALLLKPFATLDVPTGQLLRMAESYRRALVDIRPGSVRGIHYAQGEFELHRALLRGAYGTGDNYLVVGLTAGEIPFDVLESEAGEELQWAVARFFRTAVPRPESVVVIDLAILRGVLGDAPTEQ
jgi:hypothetical protein